MDFLDDFILPQTKEPTYYEILGCSDLSDINQITTEYRIRARKYHPDKNLEDPKSSEEFSKLQLAKDTLTDPEQRKEYDTWLKSGVALSYQKWKAMKGSLRMCMHWVNVNHNPMIEATENTGSTTAASSSHTNADSSHSYFSENLRKFRNYEL